MGPPPRWRPGRVLTRSWALLSILLLVALGLRLYGLQWDQGGLYHPDERQILMTSARLAWPASLDQFLDPEASPLNPRFFAYGSLPMYVLEAATNGLASLFDSVPDLQDRATVGRVLSALSDLVTILFVFLIGRRLYNERIAFLAAVLVSFTVLHVQLSHFYTVDIPLTTFALGTLYFSTRLMQEGKLRDGLLAGLFLGLAVSTKVAAAPLGLPVLFAWALSGRGLQRLDWRTWTRSDLRHVAPGLLLTGAVAAAVFVIAQPYAVLDFESFKKGVLEQAGMARGALDFPYTRQFAGTTPYWFHIQQLSVWGMGIPLGITAWAGFALVAWRGLRRKDVASLFLLSWVGVYFLLTAGLQVKFMRYMAPITPLLGLFAALFLWEVQRRWRTRLLSLALGEWIVAAVVFLTFLYALAYANIYSQPHPAERMSAWIKANIPIGTVIAQESAWDEPLRDLPESGYLVPHLRLYEPDNALKVSDLARNLERVRYIAIYSERIYVSTSRLTERYPITRSYYEKLFSGELGFEPVRVYASYPNLLGVSLVNDTTDFLGFNASPFITRPASTPVQIDLGYAQESFVAYDHPKVILFAKSTPRAVDWYADAIAPDLDRLTASAGPMLTEEEQKQQQRGGDWASIFNEEGFTNRFPLLTWYVAFQAIVLAFLPISLLLFRPLADRGYLLTKTLALLAVAYVVWLFASTNAAPFSRASILLTIVLVGVLSAVVTLFWRQEILEFLRRRWRFLLFSEALFLLVFLAFVWLRAANPDLWHAWRGGEKPMDFAYLNAVTRSTIMPPLNPWFAGGYINYYYFGQFIIATLIRLTGIVPEVAYNLAIPLVFALTLTAAFSLTYNLIELTRRAWGWAASTRGVLVASLAGGIFVTVIGNLDGLIQWTQGVWKAGQFVRNSVLPEAGVPSLEDLRSVIDQSGYLGVARWLGDVAGGLPETATLTWQAWRGDYLFPAFDFWRSSRMLPGNHITEFPFFTFLFGDLHAHMVSLPITLVALGLALTVALRIRDGRRGLGSLTELGLTAVFLSGTVGILWATNAWDYPTYLLAAAAAVGLGLYLRRAPLAWTLAGTLVGGLAFFFLSRYLLQPYLADYQVLSSGVRVSTFQTNPLNYLAIHGLFLYVLLTVIALGVADRFRAVRRASAANAIETASRQAGNLPPQVRDVAPWGGLYLIGLGLGALGLVALGLLLHDLHVLELHLVWLLYPVLLALVALILSRREPLPYTFALGMAALALGLGIGVEVVTVDGDIDRMNTVFKLYLQAWVLFGVATGYFLWYLGQRGLLHGPRSLGRKLWLFGLGLLLLAVVIYPVAATGPRLQDRFSTDIPLTLDGMAYMDQAVYSDEHGLLVLRWDREAIDWLRQNVRGTPVIVEGVTPEYRWGARVSIYTGLPTVLGWNWHQRQQRGAFDQQVWDRQREVNRFYDTPDPKEALAFLDRYSVEYVYVGALERAYYQGPGIAKFQQMEGEGLEAVYQNPQVTIYHRTGTAPR